MDLDDIKSFCKKTGIIFPNSEIYGGLSGFWDYGPVGTQIKKNMTDLWWEEFVERRDDIVGIDGSIISSNEVWKASGHVDSFSDPLVDCKKCKRRVRADRLIEEETGKKVEGEEPEELNKIIEEENIRCSRCGGELAEVKEFNLMFETNLGPVESEENKAYLRPETAQLIFTNFKNVRESTRQKLPFGIAQTGKAFRNEISPRNFVFRNREFEQLEIEYFVHPDNKENCPFLDDTIRNYELQVLTAEHQEEDEKHERMTIGELIQGNYMETEWLAYWLYQHFNWFVELGVDPEDLRLREHPDEELAHYASSCFDIEYRFPFGWDEVYGNADRGDYDLRHHQEHSGKNLGIYDQDKEEHVLPHVASEPSQGIERSLMVFIMDAYTVEEDRKLLKLDPRLAPVKCRIFPLMAKDGLDEKAKEIHADLKDRMNVEYEERGSIGKRYARADEIGVPYCVTVDYDTMEDDTVTIRDRDSTDQIRVSIDDIPRILRSLVDGTLNFDEAGEEF
ncbi:MAG: glycine--tRNA ligase [Candidatus Aenigmatarchaeota archaeon]